MPFVFNPFTGTFDVIALPIIAPVRGGLIYANSTPAWTQLANPSVLSGLSHDGTDVSWVTATGTGAPVRATAPVIASPVMTGQTLIGGTVVDPFGSALSVQGNSSAGNFDVFSAGNSGGLGGDAGVNQFSSRGTNAAPTACQSGDRLGGIYIGGYGTSYAVSALIGAFANQAFTASAKGTYLTCQVTPNGSTTRVDAWRVNATGDFGVGTTGANIHARLHVISTTEQLQLGYDISNAAEFTVSPVGSLTLAVAGTNPSITLTPSGSGIISLNGPVTIPTTLKVTALTAGSVLFAGASGLVSQNVTAAQDLFWDDTNHLLGINTSGVPTGTLHVVRPSSGIVAQFDLYASVTGGARINARHARGSVAAPRRLNTNDVLGVFNAFGAYAVDNSTAAVFQAGSTGTFNFSAAEDFTSTTMGTNFLIGTTFQGAAAAVTRMLIDSVPAGTITVYPKGNGSAGWTAFENGINPTGTDYTQANIIIAGLTGVGSNPPGTGLTTANYFNPNIFFAVTDGTNRANAYGLGSEGNWTSAGGFGSGYGFYIYDQIAGKTALTIGYGSVTTVVIGAVGTPYALLLSGKVSGVLGVNTVGAVGVPAVFAAGRATAQVAANASVSTFTVGASDASFDVSANVLVTTSTLHNFTVTCSYTDDGNTARVLTLQFSNLAGALVTVIANAAGAVPYEGVPLHIRCKASTAITFGTTGTFTSVVYNAEGIAKQTA